VATLTEPVLQLTVMSLDPQSIGAPAQSQLHTLFMLGGCGEASGQVATCRCQNLQSAENR
jgi:hypothetical protein